MWKKMKKKLTYFVVDDDAFCLNMYEQYLLKEGIKNVHVFNNGEDCINNLHENPDIILLDYHMRPENGIQILNRIKKEKPDTYVVMISATTNTSVAASSLHSGAFEFIQKDEHDLKNITQTIQRIIENIHLLNNPFSSKWN
jgi:DNA-binding NtrC family response regulator